MIMTTIIHQPNFSRVVDVSNKNLGKFRFKSRLGDVLSALANL